MADVRIETWRCYLKAAHKLVGDVADATRETGYGSSKAIDAVNNARAAVAEAIAEFTKSSLTLSTDFPVSPQMKIAAKTFEEGRQARRDGRQRCANPSSWDEGWLHADTILRSLGSN